MNSIATHVEFLLKRHDCVVLPGIGAFLCNYVPAHFDTVDSQRLNPPGRSLAFNPALCQSDGLLASSVARKEQISYEVASRTVADEVEVLMHQLETGDEIAFGRLGSFRKGVEGQMMFEPADIPSINGFFYGLKPVAAVALQERPAAGTAPYAAAVAEAVAETSRRGRRSWRTYAGGIAASLAVIATLAMFILHPIRTSNPTETASIAPVPEFETVQADFIAETPAADMISIPVPEQPVEVSEEKKFDTEAEQSTATLSAAENKPAVDEPVGIARRFNNSDPYCVIVASFPSREQARSFVDSHPGVTMGVLEKDNKYRIYSATAPDYKAANEQKSIIGQSDAWVCRR